MLLKDSGHKNTARTVMRDAEMALTASSALKIPESSTIIASAFGRDGRDAVKTRPTP